MGISGRNALVCVSGGPDSMALLHFVAVNREKLGIKSLRACHFNHGLRGPESDSEEAMVRDFCSLLGVKLSIGYGRMKEREAPQGKSEEMWARDLRYSFFRSLAAEDDSLILVAHNLNDSAETLLFHIARGSGIRGARGIEPVYGSIRRPFILVPRSEIEEYIRANSIPYATDSSNLSEEYSRNRIRLNVIPELEKVNESFLENAGDFMRHMDDAYRYLERSCLKLLEEAKLGPDEYSCSILTSADDYICVMALKRILDDRFDSVTERDVQLITDVTQGKLGAFQFNDDYRIEAKDGILRINRYSPKSEDVCEPEPLKITDLDGKYRFGEYVISFKKIADFKANCSKSIYKNCIDYDKIVGKLTIRGRMPGDTFSSAVRHVTKTVKKLFTEMKLNGEEKVNIPILSDDLGVLWIPGEGPDQRAAITDESRTVILISAGKEISQ